jgi:hypothetical protein
MSINPMSKSVTIGESSSHRAWLWDGDGLPCTIMIKTLSPGFGSGSGNCTWEREVKGEAQSSPGKPSEKRSKDGNDGMDGMESGDTIWNDMIQTPPLSYVTFVSSAYMVMTLLDPMDDCMT